MATSSRWNQTRECFAAVRELLIVVAMALLLVAPSLVRTLLERAGVRSVAGVEFDLEQIADSQSELLDAERELTELRLQLLVMRETLNGGISATEWAATETQRSVVREVLETTLAKCNDATKKLHHVQQRQSQIINHSTGEPLASAATPRPGRATETADDDSEPWTDLGAAGMTLFPEAEGLSTIDLTQRLPPAWQR